MQLSRYEQETIVNFNEEEDMASIYTHSKALRRKLKQLSQERPEECRLQIINHGDQGEEYCIPKAWVKITPSRRLSEEQRAALSERMKANLRRKHQAITLNSDYDAASEGSLSIRGKNP